MDRYLYKAKRLDNGEWVQGVPFKVEGKWVLLINDNENLLRAHYIEENMWTAEIYAIEVDSTTICQCTGLKDKNGKLIWENDIVRDIYGNFYAVFYQNNYYWFSWICVKSDVFLVGAMWNLWSFHSFEVEVIGNIFDNSDLLGTNTQNDLERPWLEKYTEENDRD
jgi:uncharacterized phage protein (TIGR01671 family)